jgi:glutaredoxin
MKKLGIYLLYGGALIFVIALIYTSLSSNKNNSIDSNQKNVSEIAKTEDLKPAEKVQVFVFHSTNRCYSCITMGQYTKATVEEFFQSELRDGKIEFKEINVDLPANKEVATKFEAVGSSLFLNAIIDGQDNIQEEAQAWRLLSNQQAFSNYLSKKIKGMIGEAVSAESKKEIEKKNITFYSGNNCSDCEKIEKYLGDNSIEDKVAFEEKNVSENKADSEQMAGDAMQCNVDPELFSIPFLWAEGKCYLGEKDIIDFFKQKLS